MQSESIPAIGCPPSGVSPRAITSDYCHLPPTHSPAAAAGAVGAPPSGPAAPAAPWRQTSRGNH